MAKKAADKTTTETGAKRGKAAKVEPLRPQAMQPAGMGGPTHEQIAQRAREVWERHGRRHGEDEKNWREAEAELKREMGIGR